MAHRSRRHAAFPARPLILLAQAFAGSVLTIVSYFGLTHSAVGPAYGNIGPLAGTGAPAQVATLTMKNGDPIITGSVAHMFQSATFVGPNETDKSNRARPGVDVMALTKAFAVARERLASLDASTDTLLAGQAETSVVHQSPDGDDKIQTAARAGKSKSAGEIKIASISPEGIGADLVQEPVNSPALAAIDQSVAPGDGAPTPIAVPSQLAYARANAPTTSFDGPETKFSSKELWCLSEAIYFEARGESYRGQVAVAQVVMNRLHHRLYPKTICGVVFQNASMRNACQFSFACDGIPETVTDKKSWAQAQEISKKVTSGELYLSEVGNATHYHAAYVYPDWAPRLQRVTRIGEHIFYRFKKSG